VALVGPAALLRGAQPAYAEPIPGGTLDPSGIAKYVTGLVIPPAMPRTSKIIRPGSRPVSYYEIAVRQFGQQILPAPMPSTTVWSYGSVRSPASFNYPAFTIEAKWEAPVRVKWINDLKDANGHFLPHLLPVDPTLHWANPPGGTDGRDERPTFSSTPGPYTGPVPIVTHLHGGHSREESDGFAEAWYLPAAGDIPGGFATVGSFYEEFRGKFEAGFGQAWEPGTAVFQYDNDQPATTTWYHDHTLGMTRLNVYAGPAGFYVLRGGPKDLPGGILPGPAPALGDSAGCRYYENPIAIQDRSFNIDGSLFYPDSREFFDGFAGPFIPDSDISPIWNPETFGNAMVVNGRTWPELQVEPRRYRSATRIDPVAQLVETTGGDSYEYDFLVIATGYRNKADVVPGLDPANSAYTITTLADASRAGEAWARFRDDPGPVVVGATQGAGCFGAAYEFLFNMSYQLRKAGLRKQAELTYVTAEPFLGHFGIGGLPGGERLLGLFCRKERIRTITGAAMREVTPGKLALADGQVLDFSYAMIVPPFVGQDVVRAVPGLADENGYVPVHDTYQSAAYPNICAVCTGSGGHVWPDVAHRWQQWAGVRGRTRGRRSPVRPEWTDRASRRMGKSDRWVSNT
jgi:hypothetical protein